MKFKSFRQYNKNYTRIAVALAALLCVGHVMQAAEELQGPSAEQEKSTETTGSGISTGTIITTTPPVEAIEQGSTDQSSTTTDTSSSTASSSESPVTTLESKSDTKKSITFAPEDELTTVNVYKKVPSIAEPATPGIAAKSPSALKAFVSNLLSALATPFKRLYSFLPNFTLTSGETSHDVLDNTRKLLDTLSSIGSAEDLAADITKVANELDEAAAKAQAQDPTHFDKADFDALKQSIENVAQEFYATDVTTLAIDTAQDTLIKLVTTSPEPVLTSYQNLITALSDPDIKAYTENPRGVEEDVKVRAQEKLAPLKSQVTQIFTELQEAPKSESDKADFDTLEQSLRTMAQRYYGLDIESLTASSSQVSQRNWQDQLTSAKALNDTLIKSPIELPSSFGVIQSKARDIPHLMSPIVRKIETAVTPGDRLSLLISLVKPLNEIAAMQRSILGRITPQEGQETTAQELRTQYEPALNAQQQFVQIVSGLVDATFAKLPNSEELEDQNSRVQQVQNLLNTVVNNNATLNPSLVPSS